VVGVGTAPTGPGVVSAEVGAGTAAVAVGMSPTVDMVDVLPESFEPVHAANAANGTSAETAREAARWLARGRLLSTSNSGGSRMGLAF
jgi:hypothetical protein